MKTKTKYRYVTKSVPTSSSASSDYYTSPAYLAQVQAQADASMANYQLQLQKIGQQALVQNQQMMSRSKSMFTDMTNWCIRYQSQKGREPTDYKPNKEVYSPSNPGPCKVRAKSGLTFRDGTCHRTP